MIAWPADDLREMVSCIHKFAICSNNILNSSERTSGRVDLLFELVQRIASIAKNRSVRHPEKSKTTRNINTWNTSSSHVEILRICKFYQE